MSDCDCKKESQSPKMTPREENQLTKEEKRLPPTIKEIMKDVIVFVDCWSEDGKQSRSESIGRVIARFGVKVTDKLVQETTHIIFRDGLVSTFSKAKQWNIPLVTLLWFEDCKDHLTVADADLHLAFDTLKYEKYITATTAPSSSRYVVFLYKIDC